jgi:hypothetical protein
VRNCRNGDEWCASGVTYKTAWLPTQKFVAIDGRSESGSKVLPHIDLVVVAKGGERDTAVGIKCPAHGRAKR